MTARFNKIASLFSSNKTGQTATAELEAESFHRGSDSVDNLLIIIRKCPADD